MKEFDAIFLPIGAYALMTLLSLRHNTATPLHRYTVITLLVRNPYHH